MIPVKRGRADLFRGRVMKLSQGKANPALAGEVRERKLKS
jgi:Asp-tRNA(Asn)/Glu-tRNA(Gln) amidotransferase B subunit